MARSSARSTRIVYAMPVRVRRSSAITRTGARYEPQNDYGRSSRCRVPRHLGCITSLLRLHHRELVMPGPGTMRGVQVVKDRWLDAGSSAACLALASEPQPAVPL